jgi:hypothetical protein
MAPSRAQAAQNYAPSPADARGPATVANGVARVIRTAPGTQEALLGHVVKLQPVTARAEMAPLAWTSLTESAIVLPMTVLRLFDLSPGVFVAFAPPALVWVWGRAVEQLAIGIERFDDVVQRRRERHRDKKP